MLTNQIAERPLEVFWAYVTSRYRGMCKFGTQKSVRGESWSAIFMREMLAVRFDRLASHLFWWKRGISAQKFEIALAVPLESTQRKQYDGANPVFVAYSYSAL